MLDLATLDLATLDLATLDLATLHLETLHLATLHLATQLNNSQYHCNPNPWQSLSSREALYLISFASWNDLNNYRSDASL